MSSDDYFADNPDGDEDALAPSRYRKSNETSLKISAGSNSGGAGKAKSPKNKSGGGPSSSTPAYFSDVANRLPPLPDFSKGFQCGHISTLIRFGLEFITRNGQTTYKAPIPPTSDINELEYISALHQCGSMAEIRQDCSIRSKEIATFLKSRHGLCVAPEVVRKFILQDGLTADKDDEDAPDSDGSDGSGGVMDLVELTSALIIPNLLRLRRKHMDKTQLSGATAKATQLSGATSSPSVPNATSDKVPPLLDNTTMLKDILALMLEDCTGDATPKPLDEELVRDLLNGYGEGALAQDRQLVREMVEVAKVGSSPEVQVGNEEKPVATFLDLSAFVEALTSDVARKYDPGRENRRSTNFDDVWYHSTREEKQVGGRAFARASETEFRNEDEESNGVNSYITKLNEDTLKDTVDICNKMKKKKDDDNIEDISPQDMMSPPSATISIGKASTAAYKNIQLTVRRIFTGQAVDYTVDNFRTRFQVVFVWMAFAVFYVGYLFGTGGANVEVEQCQKDDITSTIVCPLILGIVSQILMICELIIFGTPFIVMGSVGNAIEGQETITRMLLTMAMFLAYNVIFFSLTFRVPFWIGSPSAKTIVHKIGFCVSLFLTAQHLFHTTMLLIKKYRSKLPSLLDTRFFKWYFLSGNVRYETKIKQSALFKVDQMLNHAYDVHQEVIRDKEKKRTSAADSSVLSNFGQATNIFSKRDGLTVYVGGTSWAWKSIRRGTLFTQEGIWLSGRLVAGSAFQICVIFAIPILFSYMVPVIIEQIRIQAGLEKDSDTSAADKRAKIAFAVGTACAFLVALNTTILYIPSVVTTTMKFRRGVIPSLRSEDFLHRYRFALDQTTLVFGGMFWGLMISSIAIGLLVAAFLYLLIWPKTQSFMFRFLGNLLGLSIVLIVKIIIMQIIRFSHYKAFYRTKPLSANIVNISMECYAIGISIWFMMVRTVKIIVISALYLGRTDTPLFSPGVGIFGPLEIDNWPTVTRKEILIHEAHRHPYIETLGYLYMMQLRYRDDGFAKRACSAWRLIFVLALMPWLHKFRDYARPDHFAGEKQRRKQSLDGTVGCTVLSKLKVDNDVLAELKLIHRDSMVSPRWQTTNEAVTSDGPGAKRFMRESMLSPRWQGNTMSTNNPMSEDPKKRADFLRSEIERLQKELTSIDDLANI